jgi:hypothetical protein
MLMIFAKNVIKIILLRKIIYYYNINKMSVNIECASLVLRTFDIVNNANIPISVLGNEVDNTFGFITANSQVITWKNVNMSAVMGDLYDKYDRFNLILSSVNVTNTGSIAASGNCTISLRGLYFCNQTYNTRSKGNTNEAFVGSQSYILPSASAGQTSSVSAGTVTFRKGNDDTNVNLTIELRYNSTTSVNGYTEKLAQLFGHQTYIFDIYGCEGYETDKHHLVKKNRL